MTHELKTHFCTLCHIKQKLLTAPLVDWSGTFQPNSRRGGGVGVKGPGPASPPSTSNHCHACLAHHQKRVRLYVQLANSKMIHAARGTATKICSAWQQQHLAASRAVRVAAHSVWLLAQLPNVLQA